MGGSTSKDGAVYRGFHGPVESSSRIVFERPLKYEGLLEFIEKVKEVLSSNEGIERAEVYLFENSERTFRDRDEETGPEDVPSLRKRLIKRDLKGQIRISQPARSPSLSITNLHNVSFDLERGYDEESSDAKVSCDKYGFEDDIYYKEMNFSFPGRKLKSLSRQERLIIDLVSKVARG